MSASSFSAPAFFAISASVTTKREKQAAEERKQKIAAITRRRSRNEPRGRAAATAGCRVLIETIFRDLGGTGRLFSNSTQKNPDPVTSLVEDFSFGLLALANPSGPASKNLDPLHYGDIVKKLYRQIHPEGFEPPTLGSEDRGRDHVISNDPRSSLVLAVASPKYTFLFAI